MSDNTVYLITGANRGIGLALATLLLARPHTTVIATSRQPSPALDSLSSSPANGTGSTLIPLLLDDASPDPAHTTASLASRLRDNHGIARVDVAVANAGSSEAFKDVLGTEVEEMKRDFEVNALGPVRVFKALWEGGLLNNTTTSEGEKERKFVLVTSSMGSIGCLEQESFPGVAYGMSKAAANWWAKKLSVEFRGKGLVVGIVHPGWVKTGMGQALADVLGIKEPPLSLEQSAEGVLKQIDNLTPETSGKFVTYTGAEIPW